MRRNLILIVVFFTILLPVCRAQSDNSLLTGTWTIHSVELRRTIDDNVSLAKTYTPEDAAIASFIRSPYSITFTAGNVTIEYADAQETGAYTLQDNLLRVEYATHIQDYTCSVSGTDIQLFQTTSYVINDDTGTVHQAKDECTFKGTK